MSRKFNALRAGMPAASRRRASARAQALLAELPLQELRRARALSQEELARRLGARQASVSRLEHRTDMYLSTLRSYVEALGGTLDIVARFPDGDVRVRAFGDLGTAGG